MTRQEYAPKCIQKYVRCQDMVATTFCAVALYITWSALYNLHHVTALVATVLRWPLELKEFVQHSATHRCGQQIDLWKMAGFGPVDGTATQKCNTSHEGSLQTWPTVHSSEDLHVEKNIILKGIIKILCSKMSYIYFNRICISGGFFWTRFWACDLRNSSGS
jgi:hypothetical protein